MSCAPEDILLDFNTSQVRRILRKFFGKLRDLEREVVTQPSVFNQTNGNTGYSKRNQPRTQPIQTQATLKTYGRSKTQSQDDRGSSQPLGQLNEMAKFHRQPRYTYRGRRVRSRRLSLSDDAENEGSSDSDWNGLSESLGTGGKSAGVKRQKARDGGGGGGGGRLVRSTSLGSLSDSEGAVVGRDPAHWLTTPQKRTGIRMIRTGSETTAKSVLPPVAPVPSSVGAQMDGAAMRRQMEGINATKIKGLKSMVIHLGELLWLGRELVQSDSGCRMRVLSLRVLTSFRLGEAIARSDGNEDLDYLDQIYEALPPFQARFVLWQHVVVSCFIRAPAFADYLSHALWSVGAFYQLAWLVSARLESMMPLNELVEAEQMASMYSMAYALGIERRFVAEMLARIGREDAAGVLWRQFAGQPDRKKTGSRCLADVAPSRYEKWVARLDSNDTSVRILACALGQTTRVLERYVTNRVAHVADRRASPDNQMQQAMEATKGICQILYLKLCSVPKQERVALAITGGLPQSIELLGRITQLVDPRQLAASETRVSPDSALAVWIACNTCHFGLVLLVLWYLRKSSLCGDDEDTACAAARSARVAYTRMARANLKRICEPLPPNALDWLTGKGGSGSVESSPEDRYSRRSSLVARFDLLVAEEEEEEQDGPFAMPMETVLPVTGDRAASAFASRVLDTIVLPLAVAGASVGMLAGMAAMVARDLRCLRVGLCMAELVLERLDAVWSHCGRVRTWRHNWTMQQQDASGGGGAVELESGCGQKRQEVCVRLRRLRDELAQQLAERRQSQQGAKEEVREHRRVSKRPSAVPAPVTSSAVQEDELGALFVVRPKRRR